MHGKSPNVCSFLLRDRYGCPWICARWIKITKNVHVFVVLLVKERQIRPMRFSKSISEALFPAKTIAFEVRVSSFEQQLRTKFCPQLLLRDCHLRSRGGQIFRESTNAPRDRILPSRFGYEQVVNFQMSLFLSILSRKWRKLAGARATEFARSLLSPTL